MVKLKKKRKKRFNQNKNWKMGFKLKEPFGIVFETDLANQP
jgi:hypothetical protein